MDFPNMVLFREDATDPYLEVYYTGSTKKLEATLLEAFQTDGIKPAQSRSDSLGWIVSGIRTPLWWINPYECQIRTRGHGKRGSLLHVRVKSLDPGVNLLNAERGIHRSIMAFFQEKIDAVLKVPYLAPEQNPGEVYVFIPRKGDENLHSYMYLYSKMQVDSVVSFLAASMVNECEVTQNGGWINDSTYRIDGLRQTAFGYQGHFSLTIEHSVVSKGYGQYIIYLSNYEVGDRENNYQVRFHDLHLRLWRFYFSRMITSSLF